MRQAGAFFRSPSPGFVIRGVYLAGLDGSAIVLIAWRDIAEIPIRQGYNSVDRVDTLMCDEFKL